MSSRTRSFKVDFFCITRNGDRRHQELADALAVLPPGGHTEAVALEGGDEKHQLRGVKRGPRGAIYTAVFGRCRFNETLTQGDEHGSEADVELKPGHGLVEKNHLIFVPRRNLVVYQRNAGGSHHSKLQGYLNKLFEGRYVLEPILQRDAYVKLVEGGELKGVEMSFAVPADPDVYKDVLTSQAAKLLRDCGALRGHFKMSVGRNRQRLAPYLKDALNSMARSGLASVAKARLEDLQEPIDLIADRLVKSATVDVGDDGKVSDHAYFSALDTARHDAEEALRVFYGG